MSASSASPTPEICPSTPDRPLPYGFPRGNSKGVDAVAAGHTVLTASLTYVPTIVPAKGDIDRTLSYTSIRRSHKICHIYATHYHTRVRLLGLNPALKQGQFRNRAAV